jgi:cell division septum initiation protein DivIVA
MHELTDLSQRGALPELKAKELKQQLLEYNRDTFGQFMQDLNKTHEKQIEANRQMRLEIKDLKLRVQEVENYLAYLRSLSNPIFLQFQ